MFPLYFIEFDTIRVLQWLEHQKPFIDVLSYATQHTPLVKLSSTVNFFRAGGKSVTMGTLGWYFIWPLRKCVYVVWITIWSNHHTFEPSWFSRRSHHCCIFFRAYLPFNLSITASKKWKKTRIICLLDIPIFCSTEAKMYIVHLE